MLAEFQPLEISWTILAFAGFFFALWNTNRALVDVAWADKLTDGTPEDRSLREFAHMALFMEATRAMMQALFVVVGVTMMVRPGRPHVTAYGHIIHWAVFLAVVIVTLQSVVGWATRRRLLRDLH